MVVVVAKILRSSASAEAMELQEQEMLLLALVGGLDVAQADGPAGAKEL